MDAFDVWTQAVCEYAFPGFLFVLHLQFDDVWSRKMSVDATPSTTVSLAGLNDYIRATNVVVAMPDDHVFRLLDVITTIHPDFESMLSYLSQTPFEDIMLALQSQSTQKVVRASTQVSVKRPRIEMNLDTLLTETPRHTTTSSAATSMKPVAAASAASQVDPPTNILHSHETLMQQYLLITKIRTAWTEYKRLHTTTPAPYFKVAGNHYLMAAQKIDWRMFTLLTLGAKLTPQMRERVYLPTLGITRESLQRPNYIQHLVREWVDRKCAKQMANKRYVKTCVPTSLLAVHLESIDMQMRRAFYVYLVHELLQAMTQLRECSESIRAETPTRIEIAQMCMPMQFDVEAYTNLLMTVDEDMFTKRVSTSELDPQELSTWSAYMHEIYTNTNDWQPDDSIVPPSMNDDGPTGIEQDDEEKEHASPQNNDRGDDCEGEEGEGEEEEEEEEEVPIRDDIRHSRWFVDIDPSQYPDQHLIAMETALNDPTYNTPQYSVMRAMYDLLSACDAQPEHWHDIMADATHQDAMHIDALVALFCKMFRRVHGAKWSSQVQRVLKQTDFLLQRLPTNHAIYADVLALHTRVFQCAQDSTFDNNDDDHEHTLEELQQHFRSLVVTGKRSRFTIQRIRWLLMFNASAAKLFRCSRRHERDSVIQELEQTWGKLDLVWRQSESRQFDNCMNGDSFTRLMQFAENAYERCLQNADESLARIVAWLTSEKNAMLLFAMQTTEEPVAQLPFLSSMDDAFDLGGMVQLENGLRAAIDQLRDNWIAQDIRHHVGSPAETSADALSAANAAAATAAGAATDDAAADASAAQRRGTSRPFMQISPVVVRNSRTNDMRLAWESWLDREKYAWQHDDRLRAALSDVKAHHQRIIECVRNLGMEWPACMNTFYKVQMEKLQILQRATPRTTWNEWMNQLLCFHALLAWMHTFAL